jgi:hypothetical protein
MELQTRIATGFSRSKIPLHVGGFVRALSSDAVTDVFRARRTPRVVVAEGWLE